mmetsp:Transcript_33261/g.61830  ORF Transcript_33261/g.61830 Transcript_33261/m.61830 type:complete len:200 (+) Transcript_33261:843-1442(+)
MAEPKSQSFKVSRASSTRMFSRERSRCAMLLLWRCCRARTSWRKRSWARGSGIPPPPLADTRVKRSWWTCSMTISTVLSSSETPSTRTMFSCNPSFLRTTASFVASSLEDPCFIFFPRLITTLLFVSSSSARRTEAYWVEWRVFSTRKRREGLIPDPSFQEKVIRNFLHPGLSSSRDLRQSCDGEVVGCTVSIADSPPF